MIGRGIVQGQEAKQITVGTLNAEAAVEIPEGKQEVTAESLKRLEVEVVIIDEVEAIVVVIEEVEAEVLIGIIEVATEVQVVRDTGESIIQEVVAGLEIVQKLVQDLVIENLVLFLFQHQVEQ